MPDTQRTSRAKAIATAARLDSVLRDKHVSNLVNLAENDIHRIIIDYLAALDVLEGIVALEDAPTDAQSLVTDFVTRARAFLASTEGETP